MEERNLRKTRVGVVVSDKMDKTIVVAVRDNVRHPLYNKIVKKTYKLKAHDEKNDAKIGDTVRVMETRPLSKDKRWRLVEIMEKAKPLLAVSVHQNSYTEESVKGPQVFYYESSAEGQKLAVSIQNALNTELSVERPRKEKGNTSYFLLKKSPCVLNIVECGFLTNEKEAELLQTEEYQQKIVEAVTKGIVQYVREK